MLDTSRINLSVNGIQLLADDITITQNLSVSPNYLLGYNIPIDNTLNNISTKISASYNLLLGSDRNWLVIKNWKDAPTGSLSVLLNIGGIEMSGYINSYSLNIIPNQVIKANVEYTIFNEITGNINNQPWSNLGMINNPYADERGVGHYWSVKFYKNRIENNSGNLVQFNYNFNANLLPKYKIGSPFPCQVLNLSADETIQITHESQFNTIFSGEKFENIFTDIDSINIYNLSNIWGFPVTYIYFPLSGFTLQSTNFDIKTQDTVLFENDFKKFY